LSPIKLSFLGVPTIECDDVPIALERRKSLALLAYVAVTEQACSRQALAELLWPEDDEQRARAGLRRALAALNETPIGQWIEADRHAISLAQNDGIWVDTHHFNVLLESEPTLESLTQVVDLYRDSFMAGFSLRDSIEFDNWQTLNSQVFQQKLVTALEQLIDLLLQPRDTDTAQLYVQRWLMIDPLCEPAQRQYMRLLAATGQRNAALRQFEHYADLLEKELGVSPSEQTRGLYQAIKKDLPIALREGRELARSTLPPLPELVIGRQAALEDLRALLRRPDPARPADPVAAPVKIAVQGWPGIGKTTLAALLAHDFDLRDHYPDGVLFAILGEQPNPFSQLVSWAHALGLEGVEQVDSAEELSRRLAAIIQDQRILLIVDDVWDVQHAQPLNVGGQRCATVFTTRLNSVARALVSQPDQIYKLPILTDSDSLELLATLAPQAVEHNQDQALELVRDLEGLPLALQVAGRLLSAEMAMGWGVSELLTELRDGVKLLEAEAPADRIEPGQEAPPTVRVLLRRSTDHLDPETRKCFVLLGVFAPKPATFDLEAMKAVWEVRDPRPTVRSLVARGLLEPTETGRFQMHALLVAHARSMVAQ
jgi:DNA-binding SARP family transcriptional activator